MKRFYMAGLILSFCWMKMSAQNAANTQSLQNDFQNYTNAESSRNYSGSYLPVFTIKENTVGSRYLFDRWVTGRVINTDNVIINTDSFVFNYDKVGEKLLATKDKKTVIEVNNTSINSFTLFNGSDSMVFEKKPGVEGHVFLVGLIKNKNGYSLYKTIKTKFEKASYSTNGIIESGKKYDEYIDDPAYYVGLPGEKEFKKVALKQKSVKEALAADADKVKKYFSKAEDNEVNEAFLIGLIRYLNQ